MAKHFYGTGECKIHTARSTPSCVQFPGCNYQTVGGKIAHDPQASHHVIPVSALVAYRTEKKYKGTVREINTVYHDTKYCSNQANNVIWLPKKATYAKHKKTAAGVWPAAWSMNRPCHDWGHPDYTEEVKEQLRKRIWDKFTDPTEPCPDPTTIEIAFKDVEDSFRKKLDESNPKSRGLRRFNGTLGAVTNVGQPEWWFVFSMAQDSKVSATPAFSFGRSAKIPVALLR